MEAHSSGEGPASQTLDLSQTKKTREESFIKVNIIFFMLVAPS